MQNQSDNLAKMIVLDIWGRSHSSYFAGVDFFDCNGSRVYDSPYVSGNNRKGSRIN